MTSRICGGRSIRWPSAAAAPVMVKMHASGSVGALTIGERFAAAVAAKDAAELSGMLAENIDFRAMTPGRCWEAGSASEVVDDILGRWFEACDHIETIEQVETDAFADCQRMRYRFRVGTPAGTFTVEQQAYFTVVAERIVWLRMMCSGYRCDQ